MICNLTKPVTPVNRFELLRSRPPAPIYVDGNGRIIDAVEKRFSALSYLFCNAQGRYLVISSPENADGATRKL